MAVDLAVPGVFDAVGRMRIAQRQVNAEGLIRRGVANLIDCAIDHSPVVVVVDLFVAGVELASKK